MQGPFDIAADLDTPVSAYMKLEAMRPRFLLESVEGGERLARYSFLGFGDSGAIRITARDFVGMILIHKAPIGPLDLLIG